MTTIAWVASAAACIAALFALARPACIAHAVAAATLLAAALVGGQSAGLPAWCATLAAALWMAAPRTGRPWLPAIGQFVVVFGLGWAAHHSSPVTLAAAATLCAGACLAAAALRLAAPSPALAVIALVVLIAPAWTPAAAGSVVLDLGEGLGAVAGSPAPQPLTAASLEQWACAAILIIGLCLPKGRWRTAAIASAALVAAMVAALAAQGGPWPVLDVGIRALAVGGLWASAATFPSASSEAAIAGLVRLATIAVLVVAAQWVTQFAPAAGPTLPHDPRAWTLAATVVALLGAAMRPVDAPRSVDGALAAVLLACAAALGGGAAAGWTVADLQLVHAR